MYAKLEPDEKEQFRILQSDYSYDLRQYDQKRLALSELCVKIQETVKESFLEYTFGCGSA